MSTNPSPCWCVVLLFVDYCIKDEEEDEGGVVGNNSLGAGELSIIDHVQTGGEEKDSWNAVKHRLQ